LCFVSVHSTGVTEAFFGSVHCKELSGEWLVGEVIGLGRNTETRVFWLEECDLNAEVSEGTENGGRRGETKDGRQTHGEW